jgi:small-conductance mechanosensitive channel
MKNLIAPGVGDVTDPLSRQASALVTQTSEWISGNFLGILIAGGAGILIALVLLGLRSLGCRMLRDGSDTLHWRTIFARALAKTSWFFIVFCAAELVSEHANTPPALLHAIHFLFVIAMAFQAAIWARELILGYVEHRVGPETEHTTLGSATGIIRLLVTVALFAIAIILILDNLGVNVTGLVAGLGIGGIAIGLAAQGIFSDLFAALSIIFDKPFRRGDNITYDTTSGNIEQIGLKTTRIRALSGEQVIISNTNLLNKELRNFANLNKRRIKLTLGLICQTPPEVCRQLPGMLREIVEAHKKTRMVRCGMVGFGDSTLNFELIFDVSSTDYDYVFQTRSEICIEILKTFNETNIQLAYPTQTSFTAAPDGSLIMPYPDEPSGATGENLPDSALGQTMPKGGKTGGTPS